MKSYIPTEKGDGEVTAAMTLSRVQKKGQITIPAPMRLRLGIKEGDLVAFKETERGILITPQEVVATEALDRIGEALRSSGISLEELIESGREIRGEIVRERYGMSEGR